MSAPSWQPGDVFCVETPRGRDFALTATSVDDPKRGCAGGMSVVVWECGSVEVWPDFNVRVGERDGSVLRC